MAIERLTVEIDADAKDLKKGISDAKKELNSLTGKSVKLGVDKNSLSAFRNEAKKMLDGIKTSLSSFGVDKKAFKKLSDDMTAGLQAAFQNISVPDTVAKGYADKVADALEGVKNPSAANVQSAFVGANNWLDPQTVRELQMLMSKYMKFSEELNKGGKITFDSSQAEADLNRLVEISNILREQYNERMQELRDEYDTWGQLPEFANQYVGEMGDALAVIKQIDELLSRFGIIVNTSTDGLNIIDSQFESWVNDLYGADTLLKDIKEQLNEGVDPNSSAFEDIIESVAAIHTAKSQALLDTAGYAQAEQEAQAHERTAQAAERTRKAWSAVKSISRGLGQAVLQPFQRAFNFVRRSIKRITTMFLRAFIFSAVMQEFNKIRDTLKNVIGTNEELKKSFATLRSAFMTAIIPIVRALEPVLIKVINLVSLLLAKLAKLTSSIFGKTLSWSVAEAKAMKNVADETKRSVAGFDELTKLNLSDDEETIDTTPIEDLATSQTSGILAKIESIFEHLRPILEKVWQTIEKIWDASKPLIEAVLGAVDSLLSSGLLQKALDLITKIIGIVNPLVTTIVNVLSPVLESVLSFVLDVLDGITNSLKPIFEVLNNTLMPIIQRISDMVRPLLDKIGKTIGKLLEPLGELIATLLELLMTALEPIFEALSPVFEIIGMIIEDLGDDLKPILTIIVQLIKVLLIPLRAINTVLTFLQRIISGIITAITSVAHWLGRQLPDAINKAREYLGNLGSAFGKITDAIGKGFKSGLNEVISGLEWVINKIIGGINWCIRGINKAFSIEVPEWMAGLFGMEDNRFSLDIKEIKEVSIPRFAKGGLVTQPTIAQIGEKGPEAVIPLNDTSWMERLAQTLNNNQSTVNLVIDGQKVGYAMINSINNITRQTGKPQLVMA